MAETDEKRRVKNFRKRCIEDEEDDRLTGKNGSDDEEDRRLALEEVKFLQKQREKKSGIPALPSKAQGSIPASSSLPPRKVSDKSEGDGEDELVLQDTFAQETAVMVEDPNMLRYVEQELAKKRGKNVNVDNQGEHEVKHADDELYEIPEHLKVKRRNSEESSTQWTTGIAEIQLPIEYKLRNIEETEAAKKLLQEKRLMGQTKTQASSSIPSSFSADYFQRGKDYAEKLRREHPELYKNKKDRLLSESKPNSSSSNNSSSSSSSTTTDAAAAARPQAATDQIMLERFRKRERNRVMRR